MIGLVLIAIVAQDQSALCDSQRQSAFLNEAQAAMTRRRFSEAATAFETALTACPGNRAPLLGIAEARTSLRQFDEAARAAKRYLDSDPGSADGRIALAQCYFMQGKVKEARAECEKLLAKDPGNARALKIKANAAYLMNDVDTAIRTMNLLLDKHPNDEDAAYMLGRIHYQEGQIDLAIAQFERSLAVSKTPHKIHDNLGLCQAALGDREKAKRHYLTAIKLASSDFPDYEWPYVNLAELLLSEDNARQAFDAASHGAKRNPTCARCFFVGAKALERLGQEELAINWSQRAAALDPNYSEAWYLLARIYKKRGQDALASEAREKFQAAKAREPGKRR